MKAQFIEKQFIYDGSQLSPLYSFKSHGIEGESVVSWIGPCAVANENMKDGEDLFAGESIEGDLMLHFITEIFEQNLMTMVSLQRLGSAIAKDLLESMSAKKVLRKGDDLYFEDGKLSISIASRDAVSSMIHFAINVSNDGTPVKTACLKDLEIDPLGVGKKFLSVYQEEYTDIVRATKKVFSL